MRKLSRSARLLLGTLAAFGLVSALAPPRPAAAARPAAEGKSAVWQPLNNGLTSTRVFAVAVDPTEAANLYAGTIGGLFKSTNGGASWRKVRQDWTAGVVVSRANPKLIFAGTVPAGGCFPGNPPRPLFRSTDAGAGWDKVDTVPDCAIDLLVSDPADPNTLYAASWFAYYAAGDVGGAYFWKSTDGGASWSQLFADHIGLAARGWAISPADNNVLYAPGDLYSEDWTTTHTGLLRSKDGGESWSMTALTDTLVTAAAVDPLDLDTVYAGTASEAADNLYVGSLLKSVDGGASWFPINRGLPGDFSVARVLVAGPGNPDTLYVATSRHGVFKSLDGGASWEALNDGLTDLSVNTLVLAPGRTHTLYAGTDGGGLFKLADGAAHDPVDNVSFSAR
ncbi:MAG TPA: hypothetical protein VF546_02695 [Pyrinomonadaceae bacterium]|jgi:photosystem II stability/assembly factor-like uncharacterized protein